MTDLHDRFRSLDRLPAPDLWDEIGRRADQAVGSVAVQRVALERGSVPGRATARPFSWAPILIALLLIIALSGALAVGATLLRRAQVGNGWIAYATSSVVPGSTDAKSGSDIYLVREGVEPRLIASREQAGRDGTPGRNVCPAFSPDGRRLVYAVEARYGRELVVLGVDAAGGITDKVRFHVPGSRWTSCPIWSSDGTRIAFVDTEDGTVTVRAPDGSPPEGGPIGLAGDPSLEDFATRDPGDPVLSPAGDRTVQLRGSEVVVAEPGGRNAEVVARVGAYAIGAWSPDGRSVLLMLDNGNGFVILANALDHPLEYTIIATGPINGQRSFPGWGDVSWQPVFP